MTQYTVPATWHADFFTELPNEFWLRAVPPGLAAAEIDFAERTLAPPRGARVLDVPCGSGRHVLELAARGHRATGVDLSEEALGHARAAAAAAGLDVALVHGDMRDPLPAGPYDLALCLGNSLGYLETAELRRFAAALAAAVAPDGGVVLDCACAAESILPGWSGEAREMSAGGIDVLASAEYDAAGGRILSTYRLRRGDEEVTATAVHHVHTTAAILDCLAEAGFGDAALHDGPGDGPFRVGAGRLMMTARR